MTQNRNELPVINIRREVVAWAKVDSDSFAALNTFVWLLRPNGYVARTFKDADGRLRLFYLHRQVLGLEIGDSRRADHINRERLDCRRANLRIVNDFQNAQNRSSRAGSSSSFRGVSFVKRTGRWRATCQVGGLTLNLGEYGDERVAAQVVSAVHRAILRLPEGALVDVMGRVA